MCMPHDKMKVLSFANLIRLLNIESHHLDPCSFTYTRTHAQQHRHTPQSNIDNIHFCMLLTAAGIWKPFHGHIINFYIRIKIYKVS